MTEHWQKRVTAVVDQAHSENWGGKHRTGFCEACANAYVVAQHAVPDEPELSDAEWDRVLWWLHKPLPPGPAKVLDEAIIRKITTQRGQ